MKRILVIGPGGAGKSTFAKRLGEILEIDVVHLDSLFWKPGWVESAKHEWAETVDALSRRDAWIMDGNYSGTLERRLAASDTVIFLDLPRLTCVWRVVKRAARYRNTTRPDMAPDCLERLDFAFLQWIWNYGSRNRPKVLRLLDEYGRDRRVIRLQSPVEVDRFLASSRQSMLEGKTR